MNAADALPHFARELSALIGTDAMLALCAAYGGRPLSVPGRLGADSALPLCIGHSAALRLIEAYGGNRIEPPKLTALQVSRRDTTIRESAASGTPMTEISRTHDLTLRQVRSIVNRRDAEALPP